MTKPAAAVPASARPEARRKTKRIRRFFAAFFRPASAPSSRDLAKHAAIAASARALYCLPVFFFIYSLAGKIITFNLFVRLT